MANIKLWNEEIDEVVVLANDIEEHCKMEFITNTDLFKMLTTQKNLDGVLMLVAECMVEILEKFLPEATSYEMNLVLETIDSLKLSTLDELKEYIYLASLNFSDLFLNYHE